MIALAALTVLDAGPARQIRAAKAAGFDAVGLRLNPLVPGDPVIAGDLEASTDLLDALRASALAVTEIGVFPIRPGMDVESLAPVLSLSHKIGARFITCPIENSNHLEAVKTFARLCDLAESCALDALVEFNPYSACRNLGDALAFVQESGCKNARLLIDALHLSRSGGAPADLLEIDPDLIALVHLCDAPKPPSELRDADELRRESRTARLYPGEGQLWLDELLDVLQPTVPLSVEAPVAAYAHLSVEERARLAFLATQKLLRRHGRLI